MSLAAWRNGGAVTHANRLELVDVDTLAGRARGTLWTTIYSPAATKFDLSVKGPELPADSIQEKEVLLSWWGLPGTGIGGMQSGGIDLGIVHERLPIRAGKKFASRCAGSGIGDEIACHAVDVATYQP